MVCPEWFDALQVVLAQNLPKFGLWPTVWKLLVVHLTSHPEHLIWYIVAYSPSIKLEELGIRSFPHFWWEGRNQWSVDKIWAFWHFHWQEETRGFYNWLDKPREGRGRKGAGSSYWSCFPPPPDKGKEASSNDLLQWDYFWIELPGLGHDPPPSCNLCTCFLAVLPIQSHWLQLDRQEGSG